MKNEWWLGFVKQLSLFSFFSHCNAHSSSVHKRNDIHCPTRGADNVAWWRRGEFENARKFNTTLDDTTLYDTMHNTNPSNNTIVLTILIATTLS